LDWVVAALPQACSVKPSTAATATGAIQLDLLKTLLITVDVLTRVAVRGCTGPSLAVVRH
ncbi:MAG: hypothetical protein WCC65_10375, partial [Pseudonocardiaceae bacterium]